MLIMYMLFNIVMIFVGVVFVTLFERKILGLMQFRLGPNKIFLKGGFQSLGDALKLMSKHDFLIFFSSGFEYNIMPAGMMFLMMTLWLVMPNSLYDFNNGLLVVLCILSVGVYPIMYGSWFSGSLYSMMGSVRSVAQMISYEVSMIMIIISLVFLPKSFNLCSFFSEGYILVFGLFVLLVWVLFISFLVELGRSPADLLEGESELVSGFNTEYFGGKFALLFLSEYGVIMFLSGLMSCVGLGVRLFSGWWCLFTVMYVMMILWVRGVVPRIRYDKLMSLCWISILNLSMGLFIFISGFIMIIWSDDNSMF